MSFPPFFVLENFRIGKIIFFLPSNLPSGDSSTPREIPGNKPRRLYSSAICIPTFVQDHERSKSYRTQSTGSQVQRKSAFQSYPMSNNSPNTLRSDSTLSSPRQNLEHGTPVSSLAATTAPLIANVAIHEDSEHSTPSKASYPAVPITSTPTTQANGLPTTPSQSGIHARYLNIFMRIEFINLLHSFFSLLQPWSWCSSTFLDIPWSSCVFEKVQTSVSFFVS